MSTVISSEPAISPIQKPRTRRAIDIMMPTPGHHKFTDEEFEIISYFTAQLMKEGYFDDLSIEFSWLDYEAEQLVNYGITGPYRVMISIRCDRPDNTEQSQMLLRVWDNVSQKFWPGQTQEEASKNGFLVMIHSPIRRIINGRPA